MNAGVGKQYMTATGEIPIKTHGHSDRSLLQMHPRQTVRVLPLAQGAGGKWCSSNLSTAREEGRGVKTPTVLLVLDQTQDLERYGAYLRDTGYKTAMCASPGEGLNSLETEPVSLVIVGQDTPEFEGRVVLERSIRLHPEVPVLVVARVLDIHFYLEVMDLGATDYLESPEPRDLAWVVDTQILRRAVA
jgi:PleD family two-component response regulator